MEIRWYYHKQWIKVNNENLLIGIGESNDTTITTHLYGFLEVLIIETLLNRMKNTEFPESVGFEVVVIVVDF